MPQIDAETSALIIGAAILAMVAGGWWLRSQSSEAGTNAQLQQEATDTALQADLKHAQEELESAYLTNKELKTTNAQLQQAANSPQQPNSQQQEASTNEALQAELTEAREEAELTLLQLHQVQEELESVYLTNQELKTTNAQLQQAANSPQQPTSQQPDPSSNEALQAELNDAREEAELTLLQLHQVQEELEHYFLLSQELKTSSAISPEQQQRLSRCNERLEQLLLHQQQRDQRLAALIDRQQKNLQRAGRLLQGAESPSTPRRQSDVALI
jgi:hypothetical protein